MTQRSNGFDMLRLTAATMVIFGHAFPLTGNASPGFLANQVQTVGVKIFFVISGYLIAKSWISDPSLIRFWLKRGLRIVPGLCLLCVVTVGLVGPLSSKLDLASYATNPATWFYFWNLLLYPVYSLPAVFEGNIYGAAVNGSLWSLPVEVAMYTGVPVLLAGRPAFGRIAIPLVTVALLCASILFVRISPPRAPIVYWGTNLISGLDAAFYFYAGATIAEFRFDRIFNQMPWSRPAAVVILILAALLVKNYVWGEVALGAALPAAVVAIGTLRIRFLVPILEGRDYSYGLYLYGFLVQQIVVYVMGPLVPIANAAIALPLTLLFAVLSWHLVEQRALLFKPVRRFKSAHHDSANRASLANRAR